ncbi:MAG: hypothetical protein AN484_11680 [Aphanizomenon flos-aquae WA102]|jgi:hypothetical protein|uniref:Uncharacterized protein n=1 Tax=Aphanizomenon flos-aquae WA102 TaxID=1710896 RepID=A0A1B7X2M4_APHFL|nr:MAG: hypothetical protein AN484_11680 [Aphanizomenon flos-aquae WA102]
MQNFINLKTHHRKGIKAHLAIVGMPNFGILQYYGTSFDDSERGKDIAYHGGCHISKIMVDNLEDGFYRFTEAVKQHSIETNVGFLKIIGGKIINKSADLESLILSDQDKSMFEAQKLRGQEILKDWEEKERVAKIAKEQEDVKKAVKNNNKKLEKIKNQIGESTALDIEAFRKLTVEQLMDIIIDQQTIIASLNSREKTEN